MAVKDLSKSYLIKSEGARQYRLSIIAGYDRRIKNLEEQKAGYIVAQDKYDYHRKARSFVIEEVVAALKSKDIKPSKPLGKFDHQGLVDELTRLIKENPDKDMEDIEIALIKIKNRYRDMTDIFKVLETYRKRLELYPDEGYQASKEDDYDDEMKIDLTSLKSQKKIIDFPNEYVQMDNEVAKRSEIRRYVDEDEELERVVGTKEASQKVKDSLADIIYLRHGNPSKVEEFELEDLDTRYTPLESDDFLAQVTSLAEDLKNDLDETNIMSYLSGNEEQEEYTTFTITNNISLQDLVKHVYEENDDENYGLELWVSVYNFSTNKDVIDAVAESYGVSVAEVVKTPGMLNRVTLRFPTELVTYEQNNSQNKAKRAA